MQAGDAYDLWQAMDWDYRFEANVIGKSDENANSPGWIREVAETRSAIAGKPLHEDPQRGLSHDQTQYDPNVPDSSQVVWDTNAEADGSQTELVVDFQYTGHTFVLIYVSANAINAAATSTPPSSPPSSAGGGTPTQMDANTSCGTYLTADEPSREALISTIRPHLTVTFGDQTVSSYVRILNFNCPQHLTSSISQMLFDLGYYGN